jgi:hypothetical protein
MAIGAQRRLSLNNRRPRGKRGCCWPLELILEQKPRGTNKIIVAVVDCEVTLITLLFAGKS